MLGPVCGLAIAIVSAATLGGCSKPEAPPPPPPEVTVIEVQPKDTPVSHSFVGVTSSSQQVEVRARVSGFLERRIYREGSLLKEGEVMFEMDRKPFEAQLDAAEGALKEQRARLWTAQANLKRVKPLAAANAVSQKDLDDATGRVNAAAAAVELARAEVETAELNLGYTTIYAPVTGVSSYARIQDGAYLSPLNSLLTYVAQIDPIWVDFSISEDEMLRARREAAEGLIRFPEREQFDVEIVLADGSVYPETGKIFFQDANYSTETGTFLIRATFSNPKGLMRPGQFVTVRMKGAIRPNAILVPQKAVLQGAKGFFVWIIDKDGKAQTRHIEVGDWQGDDWFVYKGLSAGEKVVTDGIVRLAKGTSVKIVEADAEDKSPAPAGEPAATHDKPKEETS
jgi:membrane fusion protein (multidrug efflux system)